MFIFRVEMIWSIRPYARASSAVRILSRVLIHQPYSETGRGQVSDLEIAANEILRMRAQLEDLLAKHSTTPVEKIREDIERDKILTAEDALSYGLIDQIISTRKMNNESVR